MSKLHGLRLQRMRKVLKSVFPFYVLHFVRYKILLTFSIILYLFLFSNTVERNFQSFNLSSAVQYYS